MRFRRHYTREEANALLPEVKRWLNRALLLRQQMARDEKNVQSLLSTGEDIGGPTVNTWMRLQAELQEVLAEFSAREIQIQDLERGLVDFPALMGGREVFLCWENGEGPVEYWRELDGAYAVRERLL
jgi:hypothetical protein